MKSGVIIIVVLGAALLLGTLGCEKSNKQSLWDQIKQLGQEKTVLRQQVKQLQSENEGLTRQVENLSTLSPKIRIEAMTTVKRIEISKRTALYDKDKDGKKEKLIVYVRPFDETGDAVKAPGHVQIQLWNLNSDSEKALLGQWEIAPAELKELWSATLMTNYYRLVFDVSKLLSGSEKELTVRVNFTDYTTGRVFSEQKVIRP